MLRYYNRGTLHVYNHCVKYWLNNSNAEQESKIHYDSFYSLVTNLVRQDLHADHGIAEWHAHFARGTNGATVGSAANIHVVPVQYIDVNTQQIKTIVTL